MIEVFTIEVRGNVVHKYKATKADGRVSIRSTGAYWAADLA
jgi:hypothetical protein